MSAKTVRDAAIRKATYRAYQPYYLLISKLNMNAKTVRNHSEKGIILNLGIWFGKGMDIQNSQLIPQTGNILWKYKVF